ncbi:MAG: kinase-like domain-containing protein [Linnemannia gamsii]|nr:MAG: kinase-like domain-containing protein [Linnemannia gamsii]
MADITSTVLTLVTSISRAAGRARVNKRSCAALSVKCNAVSGRLERGELGSPTDPRLEELLATLAACNADLTKFSGLGFLLRYIRSGEVAEILTLHSGSLDKWLSLAKEGMSDEELGEERRGAIRFKREVLKRQDEGIAILKSKTSVLVPAIPPLLRAKLEIGEEVGEFPFGTIYTGVYDGKPVYVRKISDDVTRDHLDLIMSSVRLSNCLIDCQNVCRVIGVCQGMMIVTDATTHGPLSKLSNMDDKQKVAIAYKVADALMAIHDVKSDTECVVHRDIRAENILIHQNPGEDDELMPKITGFEMCKQNTTRTGNYPDIDKCYRRWWSPERTDKHGTSPASDVYAFGVLMYEISTGKEPESVIDLVKLDGMRICSQYTTLMERCLDSHYNSRPKMCAVAEELLSIQNILLAERTEP